MFKAIKRILGSESNEVDYPALLKQGAIILDVRSIEEYSTGHIQGSINVPVESLNNHSGEYNKPIITCCASGARSALASRILKTNGFLDVYNDGGWKRLQDKIQAE